MARTDAEAASLLDGCGDERDQPFILGVTNGPTCRATSRRSWRSCSASSAPASTTSTGTCCTRSPTAEYAAADCWLDARRPGDGHRRGGARARGRPPEPRPRTRSTRVADRFLETWQAEAGLKTYGEAVADAMAFRADEGIELEMTADEWASFAAGASWCDRARARRGRSASTSPGTRSCPRRPRATTRSRAGSTTRSPSHSPRPRSPTCCGWRRRPPTSTMRADSPTRSMPTTRRRCSRTTCRRRSTGTRPG